MRKKKKVYTKLPGTGQPVFSIISVGKSTLWMGADHLLLLKNRGYSEEYKRFYYKDIQALILQKTVMWKIQNAILGLITAIFLVSLGVTLENEGLKYFNGVMSAAFIIITTCNILRGVSCKCYLQTAVQTERLYSLHHVRTALKAFKRLKTVIEAEQGPLTSEMATEVAASLAEQETATTAHNPLHMPTYHSDRTPRHYYHGRPHEILFLLLLLDVLLTGMEFVTRSTVIPYLGMPLLLAIVIFLVLALIKNRHTTMPGSITTLLFITLGYIFLSFIAGSTCVSIYAIANREVLTSSSSQFAAWVALDPGESLMKTVLLTISMICSGLLGMLGLLFLWRYRRESVIPEIPIIQSESPAPATEEEQVV